VWILWQVSTKEEFRIKKLLKNFHRIPDFVLKRANLAKFNECFEKGAVS
jgi:hypothetical protein